jgi:hypothetical protein
VRQPEGEEYDDHDQCKPGRERDEASFFHINFLGAEADASSPWSIFSAAIDSEVIGSLSPALSSRGFTN